MNTRKPSGSEHFSKARRMGVAADFNAAFKQRTLTVKAGAIRVIVRRNGCAEARLGLIVAKRVLPRAADRNRVKRLLRERFRRRAATLPKVDLVVQALSRDVLKQLPETFDNALDRVAREAI
ncbi:MAG: ribonuclease P protein component [Pseudomonadota bacterium]